MHLWLSCAKFECICLHAIAYGRFSWDCFAFAALRFLQRIIAPINVPCLCVQICYLSGTICVCGCICAQILLKFGISRKSCSSLCVITVLANGAIADLIFVSPFDQEPSALFISSRSFCCQYYCCCCNRFRVCLFYWYSFTVFSARSFCMYIHFLCRLWQTQVFAYEYNSLYICIHIALL